MNPGFPEPTEYGAFFAGYMSKASGVTDPAAALDSQLDESLAFLNTLDETKQLHRYADSKWSIKEVVNHLTDAERVFAYRAMRVARNDQTPLSPFEENSYIRAFEADRVPWNALLAEFEFVRKSSVQMLKNLPDAAWTRIGTASGVPISVRAMALIMYGHVAHHMQIVRERYL